MALALDKQTSRILHDEHMATLAALDRLEAVLTKYRDGLPETPTDDFDLSRSLREMVGLISTELSGHFAFEERELFPRLAAIGDGVMGQLLTEEHKVLLPAAGRLADDCADILAGTFDQTDWSRFRIDAAEFIETLTGHVHKEEMGLLAALEATLDVDTDQELAMNYSASR